MVITDLDPEDLVRVDIFRQVPQLIKEEFLTSFFSADEPQFGNHAATELSCKVMDFSSCEGNAICFFHRNKLVQVLADPFEFSELKAPKLYEALKSKRCPSAEAQYILFHTLKTLPEDKIWDYLPLVAKFISFAGLYYLSDHNVIFDLNCSESKNKFCLCTGEKLNNPGHFKKGPKEDPDLYYTKFTRRITLPQRDGTGYFFKKAIIRNRDYLGSFVFKTIINFLAATEIDMHKIINDNKVKSLEQEIAARNSSLAIKNELDKLVKVINHFLKESLIIGEGSMAESHVVSKEFSMLMNYLENISRELLNQKIIIFEPYVNEARISDYKLATLWISRIKLYEFITTNGPSQFNVSDFGFGNYIFKLEEIRTKLKQAEMEFPLRRTFNEGKTIINKFSANPDSPFFDKSLA